MSGMEGDWYLAKKRLSDRQFALTPIVIARKKIVMESAIPRVRVDPLRFQAPRQAPGMVAEPIRKITRARPQPRPVEPVPDHAHRNHYMCLGEILSRYETNGLPAAGVFTAFSRTICVALSSLP